MLTNTLSLALLALAGVAEARSVLDPGYIHEDIHRRQNKNTNTNTNNNNNNNQDATAINLAANAIQSGSFVDGSPTGAEAKSQTSQNNFINNCAGKTLTNGLQFTAGSCNGIIMGDIPAKTNMVSSIITFPLYGSATIQAETTFNISVQMANIVAGSFTNADATYYAAPQQLSGGKVIGHTHVTVQDIGNSLNPQKPLDATQFAFFKGINDAGNGKGLLQAVVTGGLPAGNYRVCTMAAASNHQPVLMPVAQRGTPDDCSKFTVVGNGNAGNGTSNTGGNGNAASSAAAGGKGTATSKDAGGKGAATSKAASATTKAAGKGANNGLDTATKAAPSSKVAGSGKGAAISAAAPTAAASSPAAASQAGSKAASTGSVAQKVTVIETFFEFVLSLGGLPPSVGKQGGQFACLGELFDDMPSAAAAACGHQYTSCVGFAGPGFSFEECQSQKVSCGAAASSASASAAPTTVTATVTVPVSVSVTGSVIAESTVAVTATAASASSVNTNVAVVATSGAASTNQTTSAAIGGASGSASSSISGSASSIAIKAVTASPSKKTSNVAASTSLAKGRATISAPSIKPPFSNSTATASPAAASKPTQILNSAAVGGIAAPAVTNSGDATRPFAVNGNTFVNKSAAVQRACDAQFNSCANAVNGGKLSGADLSACQTQKDSCNAAA